MSSLNQVVSLISIEESKREIMLESHTTDNSTIANKYSKPHQQGKEPSNNENTKRIRTICGVPFVRSFNAPKKNVRNTTGSTLPTAKMRVQELPTEALQTSPCS